MTCGGFYPVICCLDVHVLNYPRRGVQTNLIDVRYPLARSAQHALDRVRNDSNALFLKRMPSML
jgi:hypothetical protein